MVKLRCPYPGCDEHKKQEEDPLCPFHQNFCSPEMWEKSRLLFLMDSPLVGKIPKTILYHVKDRFTHTKDVLFRTSSFPRLEAQFTSSPEDVTLHKEILKEARRMGVSKNYGPTQRKPTLSPLPKIQLEIFKTLKEKDSVSEAFFSVLPDGAERTPLSAYFATYQTLPLLLKTTHPYGEDFRFGEQVEIRFFGGSPNACAQFLEICNDLLQDLGFHTEGRTAGDLRYNNTYAGFPLRIRAHTHQNLELKGSNLHTVILEDFGEWDLPEHVCQKSVWASTFPQTFISHSCGGRYIINSPPPKPGTFWEVLNSRKKDIVTYTTLPPRFPEEESVSLGRDPVWL